MNSHILLCFVYHVHDILCCIKKIRLDFRSVIFKCKFGIRPRHKAQYRAVISSEAFGDSCNPPSTQRIHFLTCYSGTRYPAPACFLKSWAITHFLRAELAIPVEQTSQQGRTKDRGEAGPEISTSPFLCQVHH